MPLVDIWRWWIQYYLIMEIYPICFMVWGGERWKRRERGNFRVRGGKEQGLLFPSRQLPLVDIWRWWIQYYLIMQIHFFYSVRYFYSICFMVWGGERWKRRERGNFPVRWGKEQDFSFPLPPPSSPLSLARHPKPTFSRSLASSQTTQASCNWQIKWSDSPIQSDDYVPMNYFGF